MQGAGLAHAPGDSGFEFAPGNIGESGDFFHRVGNDSGGAFGAVGCPVLVAAEVEIVGLFFVGQRRQVRHVVAHFGEAPEHGLVVFQGLVVVVAVTLGRHQFVAVDQPAGRLIHHHQFHTFAFERIVQLLHASVAGRGGIEFGAQVFLGAEQPVAFSLHQGGEVLLVAGGVVFRIVGLGAQVAAGFCVERRGLNLICLHAGTDSEDGGGQARQA